MDPVVASGAERDEVAPGLPRGCVRVPEGQGEVWPVLHLVYVMHRYRLGVGALPSAQLALVVGRAQHVVSQREPFVRLVEAVQPAVLDELANPCI